jgi:hypothetical protein
MGRTAICHTIMGKDSGETEAMLEADHILLRGDVRAKLPLPTLRAVRAEGDGLHAKTELGALTLMLGEREAALWQKKILPPPSLAKKLGVVEQFRIHVIDAHPQLMATLADITSNVGGIENTDIKNADIVFALIDAPETLQRLPALAARIPQDAQLWVLRPKGKAAAIKESALMEALRAMGFRPNKTAAWSAEYAADRYRRAVV